MASFAKTVYPSFGKTETAGLSPGREGKKMNISSRPLKLTLLVLAIAAMIAVAGCTPDEDSNSYSTSSLDDDDDLGGFVDPVDDDDDASDDDDDDNDDNDDDTIEVSEVSGRFDLTDDLDFYASPFPSDLRLTLEGAPDVANFPNPRGSTVMARYLEVGQRDTRGFGANSPGFFSFTGPIDPNSLPAEADATLDPDASAYFVGIDPTSPDYGQRYPVRFDYKDEPSVYGPAHFLVMLPVQGATALFARTYAFIVTDTVTDTKGLPLAPSLELQQILAGGSSNVEAVAVFEPLADYLDDTGIDFERVVVATVFTTGSPIDRMIALRDHAYSYDLPGIDPQTLELTSQNDDYYFLAGQVTIPIYQKGQIPYVVTGGAIFFDSQGVPIVQSESTTRMAFTIPKGPMPANGWPFLVYSHGSGGSWKSFTSKGVARWLAKKGIAAVSIDAPHHGTRNPISDDSSFESFCFYNALNPESFRDNNPQAAAELMAVLRQTLELTIPAELLVELPGKFLTDHFFDSENVFFMGHSQGSTVGPLIVAVDPHIRAAYFSGAGASIMWNLLTKTSPFATWPAAAAILHYNYREAARELNEFNPVLGIIQHLGELVDPTAFNPYFFGREVPGAAPKHVFQAQGTSDSYVGLPCHGAFAAAAYMDLVEPLVDDDAWWRIAFTGGDILPDDGIAGNRLDYLGEPATSVMAQYPQFPAGGDGHYVSFQYPEMQRRIACFFSTYLEDGIPTLVDNSGDISVPCF
jgi:hypothetical protein